MEKIVVDNGSSLWKTKVCRRRFTTFNDGQFARLRLYTNANRGLPVGVLVRNRTQVVVEFHTADQYVGISFKARPAFGNKTLVLCPNGELLGTHHLSTLTNREAATLRDHGSQKQQNGENCGGHSFVTFRIISCAIASGNRLSVRTWIRASL